MVTKNITDESGNYVTDESGNHLTTEEIAIIESANRTYTVPKEDRIYTGIAAEDRVYVLT